MTEKNISPKKDKKLLEQLCDQIRKTILSTHGKDLYALGARIYSFSQQTSPRRCEHKRD